MLIQGDHNWTMKNPEVWADMRATEETMMIFSNSMDVTGWRVGFNLTELSIGLLTF